MHAATRNKIEMVRLLLDKGANTEVAGEVTSACHQIGLDASISLVSGEGFR